MEGCKWPRHSVCQLLNWVDVTDFKRIIFLGNLTFKTTKDEKTEDC